MSRIHTCYGDITSAKGIIVHGCNAQGVMGSGVALAIKRKFPDAYAEYMKAFQAGKLRLGTCTFWTDGTTTVINGVTQEFYGRDGKKYVNYDAVREVFEFVADIEHITGSAVNFPLIGCGLGGGVWSIVEDIILKTQHPNAELNLWVMP